MDRFLWKIEPTYQKTLNFVEKTLFFGILVSKIKNTLTGIRIPNRGDAQTYVLFKALTVLLCNMRILRVMGKISERKKMPTTELNIFLSKKFFDGNNDKLIQNSSTSKLNTAEFSLCLLSN